MSTVNVLECVVNVSEGRNDSLLTDLRRCAGPSLLDVHRDADHNRSVFSLGGPSSMVEAGARSLARETVARVDLRKHRGVHPRIGSLDVVPFIALKREDGSSTLTDGDGEIAVEAGNRFARWAAEELHLPCFVYGTQRGLPEVRRRAWKDLAPDTGPARPHPYAGACAVGARRVLVAYNLWLDSSSPAARQLEIAQEVAAELRRPALRTLGLAVATGAQVSCNLVSPWEVGPAAVFDAVASRVSIARAELVGLLPRSVLEAVPRHRWPELGLGAETTIEARLEEAGLDGGRFSSAS